MGDSIPTTDVAGWVPAGPPGLRAWPAEPAVVPGGRVVLAEDADGRTFLCHAASGPGEVEWIACLSEGSRRLKVARGRASLPVASAQALAVIAARAAYDGSGAEGAFELFRLSDGWDGEAAEAMAALARSSGGASLAFVAHGGALDWFWPLDHHVGADAVDAVLARRPILAPVMASLAHGFRNPRVRELAAPVLDPATPDQALAAALAALDLPKGVRGDPEGLLSLRRLLRQTRGMWLRRDDAATALRLCGLAPRDWMPADREGVEAMVAVLRVVQGLVQKSWSALDAATLLSPVRGDWLRARDALARHGAVGAPAEFCEEARDMCEAFAEAVLRPAKARAAGRPVPPAKASRDLGDAWRALFGGKGVVAVAEISSDWHRRASGMSRAVAALSPLAPRRWARTLRDHTAADGTAVLQVLDLDGLVDEGSELAHCVATYAGGCARGEYAILSVRDPEGRRSSTVQVGPDLRVVQHKGARNAVPEGRDVEAVASFLRAQASGRNALPGLALKARSRLVQAAAGASLRWRAARAGPWVGVHPYDPADAGTLDRAAGIWSRYLPRHMRGGAGPLMAALAQARPA